MRIALFSDVHGRLRIMLHMPQCWQIQHRTMLDAAIIAGDLGCFPNVSRFDKATRRWIERDPEEAGFPEYFMKPKREIEEIFEGAVEHGEFSAVRCPIFFVAGNHEDFEYLRQCERRGPAAGMHKATFPVDCYQKVHCIRNGSVLYFPAGSRKCIRIAGLWGIENVPDGDPRKISKEAARRLMSEGSGFDLLVTHDAPAHCYPEHRSSATISEVLRARPPAVHLFGHAHPVNGQHEFYAEPIPTHSWIFEDVCFGKSCNGNLEKAMGLLTWETKGHKVEIVADEWLGRMRHRTWQHVWSQS